MQRLSTTHRTGLQRYRLAAVAGAMATISTTAMAVTYENTSHRMASGDFFGDGVNEVAYIQSDGSIFIHDFVGGESKTIDLPSGELAVKLVAADIDGDGRDDLGIVTSNSLGLRTYDFDTMVFSAVNGSSIQDITAANLLPDGTDEIILSNTINNIFLFNNGSLSQLPGAGSALAKGSFNGDGTDEFIITGGATPGSGTGVYDFDGENFSFTTFQGGGGAINRLATGNLNPSDATDEVYLTNTAGSPYVTDGAGYVFTTGNGTEIGIGQLDADLGTQELAYIIGAGGSIFQSKVSWGTGVYNTGYVFLPIDPTSNATAVADNSGFTDFILADIDNDGLDELLGLKGDSTLYRFDNGDQAFSVSAATYPEPTTAALVVLALAPCLRRRRRA